MLGMALSSEDTFVDSDEKRDMLVDRVHHYFNMEWKLEVLALTSNLTDGLNAAQRQSQRVIHYNLTDDHLHDTVNKIDRLRGLWLCLKPETVDLIRRCKSSSEIKKCMLAPFNPTRFLAGGRWT
jgi:hypothetical protein